MSMYVAMDSQKICKLIFFCTDWKTTFTRGKQLSLSGNLVGKHDLSNAGGGGATCSRLKYQREQDEMRERILSKVRPAPRIFALLKLPWGMRGLETKTYQMTQKISILEERNYYPILKVILRPKELSPLSMMISFVLVKNTSLSFLPLLEMSKVITYK